MCFRRDDGKSIRQVQCEREVYGKPILQNAAAMSRKTVVILTTWLAWKRIMQELPASESQY